MKTTILKIISILILLIVNSSLMAESQGEIRSKKNIQISIIKLKGYGFQSEYFFNSHFSLGIGAEKSKFYQNQAIWGTSLNSFYYENEIKDYKRDSLFLSTNYYPFQSLGLYVVGRLGYTNGGSVDEKNKLSFGFDGSVLPAFPKEQYGHRIEESPRGFAGAGLGYKHIFSSGLFIGSEFDLNFYPRQRFSEKYSIYADSSTLLPNAKFDIVDYLYLRQVALDSYHPSKGFGQLKIFFGFAF